jgi:hypothetical protein
VDEKAARVAADVPVVTDQGGAVEAARVERRLERIETLDRERAPAGELLGELRLLVHEAEAWARTHAEAGPGPGAPGAGRPEKVREEAEGMQ